jgi:hypothetical protein
MDIRAERAAAPAGSGEWTGWSGVRDGTPQKKEKETRTQTPQRNHL